jgi:hypothetical protein
MARPRMTIQSDFPAVKKAGWETVQEAREVWLEVGQETADHKANDQAASRGYELQVGIEKERLGHQSARIFAATHSSKWGTDPWFLRFFEYGSVQIPAMPFMRPAARKANKAFVARMGSTLEGNIRKRTGRSRKRSR